MKKDLKNYCISHLDEALEKEEIKIFYQPLIRTLTGNICGLEALSRWESPEYGELLPESFIPVLEEKKLIHKLDTYVIKKVCRHLKECIDRKTPFVPISINLSYLDFELTDIIEILNEEVEKTRIYRQLLRVELNGSRIDPDSSLMKERLETLDKEGYTVIMDDFGSGHSSINVLRSFIFDELKLDMRALWDSGEKSRTIIESLSSLVKTLDISSIAEGVESREEAEFLFSKGCEKMQGFYFAPPLSYGDLVSFIKEKGMTYEPLSLREYYRVLGKRDIIRKSEDPYGIAELSGEGVHFIYTNPVFMSTLKSLGIESFEDLEDVINDTSLTINSRLTELIKKASESDETRSADFVWKGDYCVANVTFLSESNKRTAAEIELYNLSMDSKVNHLERVNNALKSVYSIFNRVEGLDIDKDIVRILYGDKSFTEKHEGNSISKNREKYINSEIYPEDRERYAQFSDFKNVYDRIQNSGRNFISGCFRFKTPSGNYVWREQYIILSRGRKKGRKFLVCTKEVDEKQIALLMQLSSFFSVSGDDAERGTNTGKVSDSTLWRAMVDTCPVGLFWKDVNRRFLGVNKAFLDYYGFSSENEVLGKTDEDMNWHIDPRPFKQDEERILSTGAVIRDVTGKCISRGESRDILVNKAPVFRDGRIIGIIGYFRDITERLEKYDILKDTSFTDPVTKVLNIRGLMDSISKYTTAYEDNKTDFSMTAFNINHYKEIRNEYGEEFMNALMKEVAERIKNALGSTSVIARTANDLFIVIKQSEKNEEGASLMQDISNEIRRIKEVKNISCTVYTSAGHAVFSECGTPEALYSLAVKRMNDQMERIRRFTGGY